MPTDEKKKHDIELKVLVGGILGGIFILLAGVWYVQVVKHKEYADELEQQTFRTVRIPAIRGKILDRNGIPLAENNPSFNVNLYLEEIRDEFQAEFQGTVAEMDRSLSAQERARLGKKTRYRAASNMVERLERALKPEEPFGLKRERFTRHYRQRLSQPFRVLADIDREMVARFQEQPDVPSAFELDIYPMRVYPQGKTAGHLLGFLRRIEVTGDPEDVRSNYRLPDFKGVTGLERAFDDTLRGRAGIKSVMVNSLGYRQSENVWQAAKPGKNLVLTLDLPIQKACERALRSAGSQVKGAAVVMNPQNGDILALASIPSYNPNLFIPKISYADWKALNDPESRPQLNRATAGIYPPGSIFKIGVGLAFLEAGVCDPSMPIRTQLYYQVGRRRIMDEARPGVYDFYKAFKRSSNYYFIDFGLKAGWKKIVEMGRRFHLGEPVKIPIYEEAGSFPTKEGIRKRRSEGRWSRGNTANLCIGQGEISVTPLQVAVMVSSIANGGHVYWPRLVQRLERQGSQEGPAIVKRFPTHLRSKLDVTQRHLNLIAEAMRGDVADSDGTGTRAAVPGLKIGGKTGTAEASGGRKITWFASMAPISNPNYVVVVMVEDGKSGGKTCAPVAKQIYEAISRQSPLSGRNVAQHGR